MLIKILKWLFFTLLFSLLPLVADFYMLRVFNGDNPGTKAFLTNGQLCLISATLGTGSLVEVIFLERDFDFLATAAVCFIFFTVVASVILYVLIQFTQHYMNYHDYQGRYQKIILEFCTASLILFVTSIIFNIASLIIFFES